ncbi:MAG: hypothetical protein KBF94_16730 [Ilumatobacteraceae bacterium]|jgi:hypothetical protein|nr:hypothetical protein [Ilumatobacteraceae bacterium]
MDQVREMAPAGSSVALFLAPDRESVYERAGLARSAQEMSMYLPWEG